MKNTILTGILLIVCLVLFKKTKESFETNSDIKNKLVNAMDEKKDKMKNDYKVFNDEAEIMALDQYNKFMILSVVTLTLLIGTIIYAKN